ncbi:MAG TPA: hypothetical protein VN873_01310 [Candidatus Angelobacter sp.]|nr:hypothetical protein [Candidatus Angelobacter sp.]
MTTTQETMLPPAPTSVREERSYLPVIISGLITTALALIGVHVLDVTAADFHIMGLHADYVIPAGAIIVGVVASSGYGLASWFSGVKITKALLWAVLVLQLAGYFGAQYIEFKSLHLHYRKDGSPVGFFTYYDLVTRAFAWRQENGKVGEPLGTLGYLFRGLEVIGFVAGGLIVPAVLRKAPYCADCQRYMKTKQLTLIPGSVPAKKVKKSDAAGQAAYAAEQQKAFDQGKQTVGAVQQLAVANSSADFKTKVEELRLASKQAAKLPGRFALHLVYCKSCYGGSLVAKLLTGRGKHLKQVEVGRSNLHSEFVRSIV